MKEFAESYLNFLKTELGGLNLTRIDDFNDFYNKQIIDSLVPLQNSKVFAGSINSNKNVIDIGFGGGFPLIPLAHKLSDVNFIGLEARAKKAMAVAKKSFNSCALSFFMKSILEKETGMIYKRCVERSVYC